MKALNHLYSTTIDTGCGMYSSTFLEVIEGEVFVLTPHCEAFYLLLILCLIIVRDRTYYVCVQLLEAVHDDKTSGLLDGGY